MVFPAPRRADDRGKAARRHLERDLVEYLRAVVAVAKGDALEADQRLAAGPRRPRRRRARGLVLHLQLRQLVDAPHRRQSLLELGHPHRHRGDRLGQVEEVEQEGDQVAHRKVARRHARAAHAEHREEGPLNGEPGGGPHDRLVAGALHAAPVGRLRRVGHGPRLALLGAAGLDRAQSAERALERGAERADRLLLALGRLQDPRQHQRHAHADHDEHRQRHPQQHQIDDSHQHNRGDQRDRAGEELDQRGRGDAAEAGSSPRSRAPPSRRAPGDRMR